MVEYGGFQMPIYYKSQSISDSVSWTRSKASLFDVRCPLEERDAYCRWATCSNTGFWCQEIASSLDRFTGPHVLQFLQRLVPTDLEALPPYRSSLSVLLNGKGGIIDDLMITKFSLKDFYVVTNAARREEDLTHFREQFSGHDDLVQHDLLDDHGLIALQGPLSSEILQKLTSHNLNEVKFGGSARTTILGVQDVLVSRGGYTGEDGFEISIPRDEGTITITQAILESPDVKLAGLAARDSLRLEAGLCLCGHDLDESISPIEAGLSWLVGKSRTGYSGYDTVKAHTENPTGIRRRVGFIVQGAPARGLLTFLDLY
jgi:aminomethyltransferase